MTKPTSLLLNNKAWRKSIGIEKDVSNLRLPVAPRQFETFLENLRDIASSDPELWAKIENALQRSGLGFTDQNQPRGDQHEDMTINVSDDNKGKMPPFPNNQAPKRTNSLGPEPVNSNIPRTLPLSPNDPSFPGRNAGKSWKDAERLIKLTDSESVIRRPITKRKPIRSLLLIKQEEAPIFNKQVITKSYTCTPNICSKSLLHFYISDDQLDEDGQKMDASLLQRWANEMAGLPVQLDHKNDFVSEVGVIQSGEVVRDGNSHKLLAHAKLHDSPISNELKERALAGRSLKFSIGCVPNKTNGDWKTRNKDGTETIRDCRLVEVSQVMSPSNTRAELVGVSE